MRVTQIHNKVKHLGKFCNIYVIPDCHIGSHAFLEDEYERLAEIIEKDPMAKVIFQGDLLDANRPSTRKIKKVAYHDRAEEHEMESDRDFYWIDDKVIPKIKRLIKTPDRCLGMLDGDHYMRMANGLTSTQYIAAKLKVPYLGDGQAVIRMYFEYSKGTGGSRTSLMLHVQHGIGGSGRSGNGVNKLEDTANNWEDIDVFVRGHSHKAFIFPISKYYINHIHGEIRQRDIWLVNTPSFRTGFILGKTDYAEQRNYGATAHKFPVIRVCLDKSRHNAQSLRVNVSCELL